MYTILTRLQTDQTGAAPAPAAPPRSVPFARIRRYTEMAARAVHAAGTISAPCRHKVSNEPS